MANQSPGRDGLIDRRTVLQVGAGLAAAGPVLLRGAACGSAAAAARGFPHDDH